MTAPPTITGDRRIEYSPVEDLEPHPRNPRKHRADIEGSLRRFGFTIPILVCERTGLIAAGHGRRKALMAMHGRKEEPPRGVLVLEDGRWAAPVVRGWSSKDDAELMAYVIADNRHPDLGGWEFPELAQMLTELEATPKGLEGVGYTPKDREAMMSTERPTVARENSYDQRADHYRNKPVRSFVFDYPVADYEEVAQAVTKLQKIYEVESAAELFLAMLREWEGAHPAPAA